MSDNVIEGPWGAVAGGPVTDSDLALARLDTSDLGNAQRLQALYGDVLAYVGDRWFGFDTRRWSARDGERLAHKCAQAVAVHIWREAAAMDAEADRLKKTNATEVEIKRYRGRAKDLREWALDTGNASKCAAMLKQAQVLLSADARAFDTHPLSFNVMNGTIWMDVDAAGAVVAILKAHDPADKITKLSPVNYDPAAVAPKWIGHLERVLPDSSVGLRTFFQACAGYWFTGHVREQKFFMLLGRGGDGKSTTMNTLRRVWGEYAAVADASLFLDGRDRNANEASPAMAALSGDVRMAIAPEPGAGKTLAEDVVKKCASGSEINARHLRGDVFSFLVHFKLIFETNVKPNIKSGDDGLFRRLILILFPTQIDRSQMNRGFEEELVAEASGILNWAIEGVKMWLAAGHLDKLEPLCVKEAIDDYRRGGDPFTEWFLDRIVLDEGKERVEQLVLFNDYTKWCGENGVEAIGQKAFGKKLGDRQILKAGRNAAGRSMRKGCHLRTSIDDLVDKRIADQDAAPALDAAAVADGPGVESSNDDLPWIPGEDDPF